jgi:hypothetical protein
MFGDGALSFQEFIMKEPLPLARIQEAIFEFLRGREDAVMFGAQAVNAYVRERRMTEDVDIMSTRGADLAEELREFLNKRFHIAVRTRNIRDGLGYRIYQIQKPENRHLADVRPVSEFPATKRIDGILVPTPEEVVASKVRAFVRRKGKAKAGTDWRDLVEMLLAYPELKVQEGAVSQLLVKLESDPAVLQSWKSFVEQPMSAEEDDEEFT